jgi:hypothetical protein
MERRLSGHGPPTSEEQTPTTGAGAAGWPLAYTCATYGVYCRLKGVSGAGHCLGVCSSHGICVARGCDRICASVEARLVEIIDEMHEVTHPPTHA